ncbi:MAG: hypothetical protein LBG79_02025 [Spirochaetaceae bacterium]|jgi:hypothetical protein|nr:hypothetical protein [Spirochaetaceae bacterium]GMO14866.1 MAG: hypothetical protein Pg6A_00760 [Termitinemataceae bacterium]
MHNFNDDLHGWCDDWMQFESLLQQKAMIEELRKRNSIEQRLALEDARRQGYQQALNALLYDKLKGGKKPPESD